MTLPGISEAEVATLAHMARHIAPARAGQLAEREQQHRARMRTNRAALGFPVVQTRNGRRNVQAHGDLPPAQVFTSRPAIGDGVESSVVGIEGYPHVPGRLSPAGWAGDVGADVLAQGE